MTETQKLVAEYLSDYANLLERNRLYVTADDVRETLTAFKGELDE